ncbi:MAG: biotin--[acetyl-CoA-carboxylase] ligase, partial [Gemmatimonadaceae bacterium]
MADSSRADNYEGLSPGKLCSLLGVSSVVVFDAVTSTMDEAHARGSAGAEPGTLVLAEEQTAGRGRNGRRWSSPPRGIWLTLIERPTDVAALEVLSLRVGLAAARALDRFAPEPLRVKWPNDLYVDTSKLAGKPVEARWRGEGPEWVAISFGVNM